MSTKNAIVYTDAVLRERQRCLDIVEQARRGESDGDLRSIRDSIQSGLTIEEVVNYSHGEN